MPGVDEIEVMSLGDLDDTSPNGPERIEHYTIVRRATLYGEDAKKAAELWRHIRRGTEFSAVCHNPAYALRFRQGGKLIFETTVCWECHNFTIPVGIPEPVVYGFDAESKEAQSLLQLLQSFVPLLKKQH
jgi:hypothetical protein